tara:strand:- start:1911 stop:2144 length:234 start_codon:yes stop_codon:yes gene_type:complete
MFNPFVNDLNELSAQELENKAIELSKKYWQTQNPDVRVQIQNVLNMYREELKVRRAQEKVKNQDNDDNSLDNLINIS